MTIEKNRVVILTYRLSVQDEDNETIIVEEVAADEPMGFIFGMSGLPEGFERQIEGLVTGDSFDFQVNEEEGYGEYDPEAVVDLPKEMFKIENGTVPDGMLEIGNMIPMTNDEGQRLTGQIVEMTDAEVTLDFNHPLAGKTMHFVGKIETVRPATAEELAHGHVHGLGGVTH